MKIKTQELNGAALDWAVAKACGYSPRAFVEKDCGQGAIRPLSRWCGVDVTLGGHTVYRPSTDWSQGGPIIEREIVSIDKEEGGKRWAAFAWRSDLDLQKAIGPTPLIAAMRCYVASQLGDEVDIPKELT